MARVEWTRLEGDDVEAVVAMLVNRERPNSVRITPSRGDGGVDILDRGAAPDGSDVVYQVKKYAEPLTGKQKTEVEESLVRLTEDPRWQRLKVATWCLVTPWDPTPEAETWLQDFATAHGLKAVWHGLAYVEGLAAKYPDVVDYYLHGGRERVEEMYKSLAALLGLGSGHDSLDVPSTVERIRVAMRALNVDPHYRYELRLGEGEFPDAPDRPGLVLTQMTGDSNGGPWAAVDIIARCAQSVHERPITIAGEFVAKAGSEFAKALDDFARFGAPFTSPLGAYSGEIDAPGGLGGRLENARVRALPAADDLGQNANFHVQIVNAGGEVVASADLDRVERSQGKDGVRWVLEEVHQLFRVEDRYNLTTMKGSRNLTFGDTVGQLVSAVAAALDFVVNCEAPNIGRMSVRGTPPQLGLEDPNWAFPREGELARELEQMHRVTQNLAQIQAHTPRPILMPDLESVSTEQVRSWRLAADLLRGEDVTFQYPEGNALILEVEADMVVPKDKLGVRVPFKVEVGTQEFDLGHREIWLESPEVLDRQERDGKILIFLQTPDRSARHHWSGGSAETD